jgi:sugar lactone lactonase YvrE
MNSLRFKSNKPSSSLLHSKNSSSTSRRFGRSLLVTASACALLLAGALIREQRSQAAPEAGAAGNRLARLLSQAGNSLRSALALSPAPVQSGQGSGYTISTIAGGAFSIDIPARSAPVVKPFLAARDPLGRGYYIVDDALVSGFTSSNLLRFINTSSQPVTLAGATINPGNIGLVAGGNTALLNILDNVAARDNTLDIVSGLAVSPDGNVVCLTTSTPSISAINVGTQDVTLANVTIPPGKVRVLFSSTDFALGRDTDSLHGLAVNFATQTFYYLYNINVLTPNPTPGLRGLVYSIDASRSPVVVAGDKDGDGRNRGDGTATTVNLVPINSIAIDSAGNLLLCEGKGTRDVPGLTIRKVTGTFMTQIATAHYPASVTVSPNGTIYVADGIQVVDSSHKAGSQISKIVGGNLVPVAGKSGQPCTDLTTGCGDGGNATDALFSLPENSDSTFQIAADDNGVLVPGFFVPGFEYSKVRYVNLSNTSISFPPSGGITIGPGKIDSIAGNGLGSPYDTSLANYATLSEPGGIVADAQGNLFIGDYSNGKLRFVNRTQQNVTIFPGTESAQTIPPGVIASLNFDTANGSNASGAIRRGNLTGIQELAITNKGVFLAVPINGLNCLGLARSGSIYFLNTSSSPVTFGNSITVNPGEFQPVAGTSGKNRSCTPGEGDGGAANSAPIFPADIVTDSAGNLYLAEVATSRIRRIDAATWTINTLPVLQSDGTPFTLSGPAALAFAPSGQLLIADTKNDRVLRQNAPGDSNYTVIADKPKGVSRPRGLDADSNGDIFVLNAGSHQVLRIAASDGTVSVIAGTGTAGFSGDGGPAGSALLNLTRTLIGQTDDPTLQQAFSITRLPDGSLAFADTGNYRVRMLKKELNLAPVLAAIPDQTMLEGTSLTVQFSATDQNASDTLTFTINGKPAFGTFTDNGNRTASLALAPGLTDSGVYDITIAVSDGQLSDSKTFRLTVNDSNRAPVITADTISSPISATSASGASVNLTGTVTDPDGDAVTWKWFDGANQIASGGGTTASATVTLALGVHSIFLEGTDSKGAKTSSPAQTVIVRDTVPPVIGDIPTNQMFEGDTLGGKVFTFTNPTVSDNIDPAPKLQVNGVPAGNKYPVGTTTITFIATDSSNNQATKSFTVTVKDTQKPTISGVPVDQTFEADTPGGKVFTFTSPTATDIVSGSVNVVTSGVPAGNLYPVGTTTVTFFATDGAANQATASFTVTVTDTKPPVISGVPADIVAEATSAAGAAVSYALPTATDIADGNVTVMADKAPGSTFPLGTTTVNFTAKDSRNNTATASFKITVQDTKPPVFSNVPNNRTVAAASAAGANVTFDLPAAKDDVDAFVSVLASPASGSLFPVGNTTVTFTAKDSRNNTATASFVITVVNVPPPTINGVPADITAEATSAAGAVVAYTMPTAVSGQGAALPVQTTHPSGSTFPLGLTTITFTATDNLGLTSQRTFKVTVVDTKPPVISGDTPNITTEALTPAGAVVNYTMPTASDLVDGNVTVNTDHPSGSTFPIGTTTVTLTAKDSHNNTATRTFTITVLAEVNYLISTFAGVGTYGNGGDGGQATSAQFRQIVAVARDKQGRLLILDAGSRNLRRIEPDGTIATIAGNGTNGNGGDGKQATGAQFGTPAGLAVDASGNIYISDLTFNRVRVIAPNGVISHFAGDSNGAAGSTGDQGGAAGAKLRQPRGLAVDANNNLFIADSGNHRIRRVEAATRIITTVAGTSAAGYNGDGALATTLNLNNPLAVAVDPQGNLFIADTFNQRIRRVDGTSQIMITLTGNGTAGFGGDDGPANLGQVSSPTGVAVDNLGNVFVADTNNNRVRRISKATGKIRTVAGTGTIGFGGDGGPAAQALLSGPAAAVSDETGNTVFVADAANLRVRKLMSGAANKPPVITSAIGNQTLAKNQTLDIQLTATDEDNDGVTFSLVNAPAFVTLINPNPAQRTATLHLAPTQAGTFSGIQVRAEDGKGGSATTAAFSITVNDPPPGNSPPSATAGALPAMIEATGPAGVTVSLSGSGSDPDNDPLSFTWKDGVTVIATTANASVTLGLGTHSLTLTVNDGRGGTFTTPAQTVLVKDSTPPVISNVPANVTVGATSPAGAVVTYTLPTATDTVSGNVAVTADVASGATFPVGTTTVHFTAKDSSNNTATASFTVTVTPQGGGPCNSGDQSYTISTYAFNGMYGYAGDGGPATSATVRQISAVARDKNGILYIADVSSRVVRRVDANGTITTLAGISSNGNAGDGKQAISATFGAPAGLAVDSKGNIYIADSSFNRVRVIAPNGVITHFAGNSAGDPGFTGDGGQASSAKLRMPRGLAVDKDDNLYIADSGNHRIRRVDAVTRVITTVAGNGVAGYGGDGSSAVMGNLNLPVDVAVDAQGNLYIADSLNHRVRMVDAVTHNISTFIGTGTSGFSGDDGPATSAQLNTPSSVAVDCSGNLYVADGTNFRIRRVTRATGKIRTIAGQGQAGFGGDGGPATSALLSQPTAIAIDEPGTTVFIGDFGNQRVRRLVGLNTPPNSSPTVGNIANQTLNKGQVLDVQVSASDPDNDPVSFSLSNAPAFVTLINPNPAQRTATLHIAPGANDLGSFSNIVIQASDGRGGTAQSNPFSITVSNTGTTNRPPVAVIAGGASVSYDATSTSGATVALDGSQSSDPDNDPLSFQWNEGTTVLGSTAKINVPLSVGSHTVTLTVSDGKGGTNTATQTITIREFVPSNDPVSLNKIDPTSGRQGQTLDVTLTGTGFQPGAKVTFSGEGITATVTALTSTQIIAKVTIASDAPVGSGLSTRRSVTLMNLNGTTSTLNKVFAVFPR